MKLSTERFSFVITTRNVDPYLDLFDKNLKGFNFTNITGRINSKENLLNLNANIPQFSYKNISFYKVDLKGNGNFDSLSLDTKVGEVYVNDSLHFPSTHIHLRSFNDIIGCENNHQRQPDFKCGERVGPGADPGRRGKDQIQSVHFRHQQQNLDD